MEPILECMKPILGCMEPILGCMEPILGCMEAKYKTQIASLLEILNPKFQRQHLGRLSAFRMHRNKI